MNITLQRRILIWPNMDRIRINGQQSENNTITCIRRYVLYSAFIQYNVQYCSEG